MPRRAAITSIATRGTQVEPVSRPIWYCAAYNNGITTVFIPKDNEKDLADIPETVKKALKIIAVSHVDQVISKALVRAPEAITWVEPEEAPVPAVESGAAVRPH